VAEQLAHGDRGLAGLGELGPILGDARLGTALRDGSPAVLPATSRALARSVGDVAFGCRCAYDRKREGGEAWVHFRGAVAKGL
jgi:hypothetical protein